MTDETLQEISKKLNVLIALSLRQLLDEREFDRKKTRKLGTGDMARYLADLGLDPSDIAEILGAPVQSIRTLLTPKRRR